MRVGTLRLLESYRDYVMRTGRSVRLYQASSLEMFWLLLPSSAKRVYAILSSEPVRAEPSWPRTGTGVNYREAYGLFICNGILFNHESPRRGETFVTRKITRAAGRIKCRAPGACVPGQSRCLAATGDLLGTTSKRCGGCCSVTSPRTT